MFEVSVRLQALQRRRSLPTLPLPLPLLSPPSVCSPQPSQQSQYHRCTMPRVADSHNTFDERVAALLKDFLDGLQGAVGAIATDPAVSHLIADRLRTVETQVVMGIQGVRMQLGGAAAALPVAVASPGSLAPPPAISPQVASAAAAAGVLALPLTLAPRPNSPLPPSLALPPPAYPPTPAVRTVEGAHPALCTLVFS